MDKMMVGSILASLKALWASEASMEAAFKSLKRGPELDRTKYGYALVEWAILRGVPEGWTMNAHDTWELIAELALHPECDFNLFSQVVPNLHTPSVDIKLGLLQEAHGRYTEAAAKTFGDDVNPFMVKRPKIKVSSATHKPEDVMLYNEITAFQRTQTVLTAKVGSFLSHRVTPYGKTPAIQDTHNLCQLPPLGDLFLGNFSFEGYPLEALYVSWEPTVPLPYLMNLDDDGTYRLPLEPEPGNVFRSESGGDILKQVLTSRFWMAMAYQSWAALPANPRPVFFCLPRMHSWMLLGSQEVLTAVYADLHPYGFTASSGSRLPIPTATQE